MRKARMAVVVVVLLALLGTQSAWAAPEASGIVHVVQRGETMYSIARHYGTTVQAIAAANGIANPNLIYVGQRLIIPTGGGQPGGGTVYVVRYGDTLSSIAWRFGVSVQAIMNANGITNPNLIYVGQRLVIPASSYYPPPPQGVYYRVQPGDTLYSIAWRYGVSVWSIVHANGLSNPNLIYAGQVIFIPTG